MDDWHSWNSGDDAEQGAIKQELQEVKSVVWNEMKWKKVYTRLWIRLTSQSSTKQYHTLGIKQHNP